MKTVLSRLKMTEFIFPEQPEPIDSDSFNLNCCPRCGAVQGDFHLSTENVDYIKARTVCEDIDAGDYW